MCAAFALLSAPASAQWLVIDPAAIAKAVMTYNQITSELTLAQQMARDIPGTFQGTNIPGMLQRVNGLIQDVQTACPPQMQTAKVLPMSCQIKLNVANVQGMQLGQVMTQLQSLQNLARGSGGSLQAEKSTALALMQLSTQLASMQSASQADTAQQRIDQNRMNAATTQRGAVAPFSPGP